MPVNPKAKTMRLVLVPKPGQEPAIRAFKEITARNGLQVSDILFEKVEEFLREHNYPPGNSQTILDSFIGTIKQKCFKCEGFYPSLVKVRFISGLEANVCSTCLEEYQLRNVVKKILRRSP